MRHETELFIVLLLAAILSWLTPWPWFIDVIMLFAGATVTLMAIEYT